MKIITSVLLFLLFSLTTAAFAEVPYSSKIQTTFIIAKPAFLSFAGNSNADKPNIFVSSFGAMFGHDRVGLLQDVDLGFELGGAPAVELITDQVTWPNEVQYVDASVFGRPGYLIASGFLVPGKTTGALNFVDAETKAVTKITKDMPDYFYHRALLVNLGDDIRPSILTARAMIPMSGAADGELVLLKPPASPSVQNWTQVVLAHGPDIHFRLFNDPSTGQLMIVTAEFSKKRLALYWFNDDGSVSSRIIDASLGAPFDVEIDDLNHDGNPDLLVSNHEGDSTASVFAYEMPANLKQGMWIKHTLVSGITTLQPGIGQASPGIAKAFYPEQKYRGKVKPSIVVSGDGAQRLFMLTPQSEDPGNWNYDFKTLFWTPSTIGEPLVYGYDADGMAEIIVPAYDIDRLYFLRLEKKTN